MTPSGSPHPDPHEDPLLRDVPEVDGHKLLDRRYELSETLGVGGMGVVYRGRHRTLGKEVAVKVLDPGLVRRNTAFVARFEKEARAAAQLRDENVVQVFDVAEDCGLHFLVMEYVAGEDARQRLKRKGMLGVDEAVRIALGAARGLAAAHAIGLVHRDVKPDNVLIATDGSVKLADLGLAKGVEGDTALTHTGAAMGTPRYMPLEQFTDAKSVGPPADVYALGATLYFLLTAADAIPGGSMLEIVERIRSQPFPDPRDVNPDVPDSVADIVRACTAKDVGERPADAGVVAALLAAELRSGEGELADSSAGLEGTASMVSPPPAEPRVLVAETLPATSVEDQIDNASDVAGTPSTASASKRSAVLPLVILGGLLLGGWAAREAGLFGSKSGAGPGSGGSPAILLDEEPDAGGRRYVTDRSVLLRGRTEHASGPLMLETWQGWSELLTGPGGVFATPVELTEEGSETVRLWLKGTSARAEITLIHDDKAPRIDVLQPSSDPHLTNEPELELVARVADTSPVQVRAGGRAMELVDGAWRLPVSLSPGSQTLVIEATDAVGRTSKQSVSLVLDASSPGLVGDSLGQVGVLTAGVDFQLTFFFDEPLASVSLAGVECDIWNDQTAKCFVSAPTTIGAWAPELVALDFAGNRASKTIELVLHAPRSSPVDAWATILAWDPDPSVVTDEEGRQRMIATGLPWRVRDNASGVEMLLVPPGEDLIGAVPMDLGSELNARPAHRVRFTKAFYLGRTELTQSEWFQITGEQMPPLDAMNDPVHRVPYTKFWESDVGYGVKTGLRLPREYEWEYACRAGSDAPLYGPLDEVAWHSGNSENEVHAVATKAANAWGFHDMLGNVSEWCFTAFENDAYAQAARQEVVESPALRLSLSPLQVVRGGSFADDLLGTCAYSRRGVEKETAADIGFRVARDP